MTTIKNQIRIVSIVLTCLILFQSCRVYHKENVSLSKAVTEQRRVRLMTKDGKKLKFKRIILNGNQYYGVKSLKSDAPHTLIQPNGIKSLRLHNETMSIIFGIITGVVAVIVGTTILFLATWSGPALGGPIVGPW